MENGKNHGTWEMFKPAKNEMPGYWYKIDFEEGNVKRDEYDYKHDVEDGFHKITKADGTIIEANYAGGKQHG